MAQKGPVRIGCYSAFWGDSSLGAVQLVNHGKIDYLVGDYLAEVTMGILARVKQKNENGGYVPDFVAQVWKPLMKKCIENGVKIVTNAGGLNPEACKQAVEKIAEEAGLKVTVASVSGDDILPNYHQLIGNGQLKGFEIEGTKDDLPVDKFTLSANAYIGAKPIVEALGQGAQVVVVGRCVDSALVLAPLIHEFGWAFDQYDLLAKASLAGHLIECACQATGGNYTDWEESAFSPHGGWAYMGCPIAEIYPDGEFFITKPEKTGGIVSPASVAEQMVYEIGDPGNYILPDVVVDMSQVTLTADPSTPHRVWVKGAKGKAPTDKYKVSVTYVDGYKAVGELLMAGFQAKEKAIAVMDAVVTRVERIFKAKNIEPFVRVCKETIGGDQVFGENANDNCREITARLSVQHKNPKALKIFATEMAPVATSMAPGVTGGGSGRPRPMPLLTHVSGLVDKNEVKVKIGVGKETSAKIYPSPSSIPTPSPSIVAQPLTTPPSRMTSPPNSVPLMALCIGRSGDKGDMANIGIICRDKKHYEHIKKHLTPEIVRNYLGHYIKGSVTRYEVPGIYALNFLATKSLDTGGLSSLRIDRQGKTYAQVMLTLPFPTPEGGLPESGKRACRL